MHKRTNLAKHSYAKTRQFMVLDIDIWSVLYSRWQLLKAESLLFSPIEIRRNPNMSRGLIGCYQQEIYLWNSPLRWSNTGNIFLQLVVQQSCAASCGLCCTYYYLRTQQNFVLRGLQKVDLASTFCDMLPQFATRNSVAEQVACVGSNTCNGRNFVARQIARNCCPYYFTFRNISRNTTEKNVMRMFK